MHQLQVYKLDPDVEISIGYKQYATSKNILANKEAVIM